MNGAILSGLSAIVAAASAALAWSQVRRVGAGGDRAALVLALKRAPAADRVAELERRAAPGSWEHELAATVLAAPGDDAKLAAVNLALDDLEHALAAGEGWPKTGLRIALLGGAMLAFVAFAAYLVDGGDLKWSVWCLGAGGLGALTCWEAGRSARRATDRQRRDVDALVATVFAEIEGQMGAAPPRRPSIERKNRRRGGRSRGFGGGSPHRD